MHLFGVSFISFLFKLSYGPRFRNNIQNSGFMSNKRAMTTELFVVLIFILKSQQDACIWFIIYFIFFKLSFGPIFWNNIWNNNFMLHERVTSTESFCCFDFDPKLSTKCIYLVYHLFYFYLNCRMIQDFGIMFKTVALCHTKVQHQQSCLLF